MSENDSNVIRTAIKAGEISVDNVSQSYGEGPLTKEVVRECSFTIERGKLTVMILDEPFRGLDAMTKELMWEYYSRLFEETRRTNFFVTTDIDEAIFLADRLLIMSNIPCQVRAVLDIDLPRPRSLVAMVEDDRANEIKMNALSILHEEAMKSFSRGSKAAADFVDAYSRRVSKS
jgi:NitT/TauT family transport system ATP-binding protein